MLAEDIGWVGFSRDEVETNHLGCNAFSNAMERQNRVTLVELGVDLH